MTALLGSCLCGEVRFETDGPLLRSSHCHCRQCQKAHRAPFRTRARVAGADFRFLAGEELVLFYESTTGTHRCFCKVCGAPVLVKFDEHSRSAQTDPGAVAFYGVALVTLDDDPGVRPDAHAFIIDKAPWFAVTDDLPNTRGVSPARTHRTIPDRPFAAICPMTAFVGGRPTLQSKHAHRSPPARLRARSRLTKGTFARTNGNGRDAPKAAAQRPIIRRLKSTPRHPAATFTLLGLWLPSLPPSARRARYRAMMDWIAAPNFLAAHE
jgi:hypothetical protein